MSVNQANIVRAAKAWALARAEVEKITESKRVGSDALDSAELAIHGVAERVEALKAAEQVLYRAIQQASSRSKIHTDTDRREQAL